jgi:predicted DNA-binding transcriptional regulator AlpA
MLKRLGNRSNNWLKARLKEGFPSPVYFGGRDAMFDIEAVTDWLEANKDRRTIPTMPQAERA